MFWNKEDFQTILIAYRTANLIEILNERNRMTIYSYFFTVQNMLDKANIHQIYEMTERQEKEIKQMIHDITHDIKYDFKKEANRVISKQKEPYLK